MKRWREGSRDFTSSIRLLHLVYLIIAIWQESRIKLISWWHLKSVYCECICALLLQSVTVFLAFPDWSSYMSCCFVFQIMLVRLMSKGVSDSGGELCSGWVVGWPQIKALWLINKHLDTFALDWSEEFRDVPVSLTGLSPLLKPLLLPWHHPLTASANLCSSENSICTVLYSTLVLCSLGEGEEGSLPVDNH